MARKGGALTSEGRINPVARKATTVGDGRHSAGSGKTYKNCEEAHRKEFGGSGILRPPSGDGRSAGMDGVVEGNPKVVRTRIMGEHDPRATHK